MKHQLIRIWSILLLAGCSCKPNPNKQPHLREEYISQEFKDYAYFKNGTWWIYYDSLTKSYDTVEVFESYNRVDTLVDFDDNPCYFETLRYKEKHSADNSVIDNYYDYGPLLYSSVLNKVDVLQSERQVHYIFDQNNGPAISFFSPFYIGAKRYDGTSDKDSVMIDSIMQSFQGINNLFGNTVRLNDYRNDLWKPYYFNNYCYMHSTTFWTKNIGITSRKLQSDSLNREWKLVNYEIIQ